MNCILEILIIFTTIGSWLHMFTHGEGGLLSRRGLESLKYYTTLSNIFAGIVAGLVLLCLLTGSGGMLPTWLGVLKYASAVSVGLTFLVVMVFLGPRVGYAPLFKDELLCLHAIGPLLTIFSFITSRDLPQMMFSYSYLAVIPTVLYGVAYIANILVNGLGQGEETNDWYGFAIGGLRSLPFAVIIILAVTWGMALLLLRIIK